MSTHLFINRQLRGDNALVTSGGLDYRATQRRGLPSFLSQISGHITVFDDGVNYKGMGIKDLKRRLKYWEGRVAEVKTITADAVGPAKGKATKLIKSGEKLLETIRGQIAQREAAA